MKLFYQAQYGRYEAYFRDLLSGFASFINFDLRASFIILEAIG